MPPRENSDREARASRLKTALRGDAAHLAMDREIARTYGDTKRVQSLTDEIRVIDSQIEMIGKKPGWLPSRKKK